MMGIDEKSAIVLGEKQLENKNIDPIQIKKAEAAKILIQSDSKEEKSVNPVEDKENSSELKEPVPTTVVVEKEQSAKIEKEEEK
eukprot:Awhi_evm1s8368